MDDKVDDGFDLRSEIIKTYKMAGTEVEQRIKVLTLLVKLEPPPPPPPKDGGAAPAALEAQRRLNS